MTTQVDSYRFIKGISRRMVKTWISLEDPDEIPWTPLQKPLSECTVAIVSSAGIALKSDKPFDQDGERDNPWWGDPSYRVLPRTATADDVGVYHLHINAEHARKDLNAIMPLTRLAELERDGTIGRVADSHYSFMGYQIDATELVEKSVPAMIQRMQAEQVDVVVLVPV